MERNLTMPGGQQHATGPTGTRVGSDEATVMERLGSPMGAAPTALEQKWSAGQAEAEPTQMERKYQPDAPKKTNKARIGAIAAVIAIILALAVIFVLPKKDDPGAVATNTAASPSAEVTSTAATSAPMPAGQGLLLLSANPYADLEKIVSKDDQKEIPLLEDYRSTPARIPLEPGDYTVTLSGPNGRQTTVDVQIQAGKRTPKNIDMGGVDFDSLAKDVTRP
jgi:hypothetical protein